MKGLATTEQLVKTLITQYNLEGSSRGLLEVIATHWGINTSGMNPHQIRKAIRAHDEYKKLGGVG